jgi:hypothetical protein
MADNRSINARNLGREGHYTGAPVFVKLVSTDASNTVKQFYPGPAGQQGVPFGCKVIMAWGIMTGAGGAGDTAVVQRVRGGTTTAVTDVADLSVFSDTDQFDFSQINGAANSLVKGDLLQVTTASGALADIYVLLVKV